MPVIVSILLGISLVAALFFYMFRRKKDSTRNDVFRNIIDVLPDPLLYYDSDERLVMANGSAFGVLGSAVDEGGRFTVLDGFLDFLFAQNNSCMLSGVEAITPSTEEDAPRLSGNGFREVIEVDDRYFLVYGEELEKDGTVIAFTDITKLRNLSRMAGNVTHDLNNVLSVIGGYTRMAAKKADMDEAIDGYLEKITSATKRAALLSDGLADFCFKREPRLEQSVKKISRNEQTGYPFYSGYTALVADDDAELLGVLSAMLEGFGLKVLQAANGNEALAKQDEYGGDIDFLLTDVLMPDLGGVRLAELMSDIRKETRVIFMSGKAPENFFDQDALPEQANFLAKPIRPDMLADILKNMDPLDDRCV